MKIWEKAYKKIYHPERIFLLEGYKFGDILFSYYIVRKGIYDFISDKSVFLKGKVLDFGCGEKPYESIIHCDEYIGVDVKVSGHDKNRHAKVDYYYEDCRLPFDDMTFDNAISTQVFEHVYEIDEILDELYRVMKIKGYIVITVPLCNPEHETPFDFFRYTTYGITEKLKQHGFTVVECKMLNTKKNAVRQMKILNAIDDYLREGGIIRALYSFFILVINNIFFFLSNKDTGGSNFSCDIGVVAKKE